MRACVSIAAIVLLCAAPSAHGQTPDFPRLISALTHPASSIRTKAREVLELNGAASARPLLVEMRSKPPLQAVPAAAVLFQIGPKAETVADDLVDILKRNDTPDWLWNVSMQLLNSIAPERRKDVVVAMTNALWGGPLRQHAALLSLAALGPEGAPAIPALKARVGRPGPALRSIVLHSSAVDLGSVAWTAPQPAYDDVLILETLAAVGGTEADVVPWVKMLLPSGLPSLEFDCARLLVRYPGESRRLGVAILASLLHNNAIGLRDAALTALGDLKQDAGSATMAIVPLLSVQDGLIRVRAAETLGIIGPGAREALPALREVVALETALDPAGAKVYQEAIDKIAPTTTP